MMIEVLPAIPNHLLGIERDPSQEVQLGLAGGMTREAAQDLCEGEGEAWACFHGDRLVACAGLRAIIGSGHAVAWAIMGRGVGAAHLAVTRFVRSRVLSGTYRRIEAVARANDAERILERFPDLDAQQVIEAVMVRPSRECRFAALAGLRPAHVLRHYGAASETHMLFERIAA